MYYHVVQMHPQKLAASAHIYQKLITIQNQTAGYEGPTPPMSPPHRGQCCPTNCTNLALPPVVHELEPLWKSGCR
jgi:hypothetical protein